MEIVIELLRRWSEMSVNRERKKTDTEVYMTSVSNGLGKRQEGFTSCTWRHKGGTLVPDVGRARACRGMAGEPGRCMVNTQLPLGLRNSLTADMGQVE